MSLAKVIAGLLWEVSGRIARRIRRSLAPEAESGQALTELAVLVPLMSILLLGIFEGGRLAYIDLITTSAARAGVQYGAQNHITAADNDGMQQAALADAQGLPGLTATASHFCTCSNGGSSSCLPTDCTGSRIVEFVKVDTQTQVTPLFHVRWLKPGPITLKGEAIMRVEQ